MFKIIIAIIVLTVIVARTSHADETHTTPQNPTSYPGYPAAVLDGSRADNDTIITQVIFTILPEMIVSLAPDRHQLHIELTDEATGIFSSLIASNKGQLISIQSPSGKEIVTAMSTGSIRGRYILSKEFENKTELQNLYKSLTKRVNIIK